MAIKQFFNNLTIENDNILPQRDENYTRTGTVHIRFSSKEDKEEALKYDNKLMNGRPLRVQHLDDNEFDNYVMNFDIKAEVSNGEIPPLIPKQPYSIYNNRVFYVEDIPSCVRKYDLRDLFQSYNVVKIYFVPNSSVIGRCKAIIYLGYYSF